MELINEESPVPLQRHQLPASQKDRHRAEPQQLAPGLGDTRSSGDSAVFGDTEWGGPLHSQCMSQPSTRGGRCAVHCQSLALLHLPEPDFPKL